jgi:hypothetical protein
MTHAHVHTHDRTYAPPMHLPWICIFAGRTDTRMYPFIILHHLRQVGCEADSTRLFVADTQQD